MIKSEFSTLLRECYPLSYEILDQTWREVTKMAVECYLAGKRTKTRLFSFLSACLFAKAIPSNLSRLERQLQPKHEKQ